MSIETLLMNGLNKEDPHSDKEQDLSRWHRI